MLRTAQSLPQEWAFDTGLRPRPFPDRAASLLPGLLAATRTGLTPASDDELTTRDQLHRPPPVCWAHESPGLTVVSDRAKATVDASPLSGANRVGFQNAAAVSDQRFHAAASYSFTSPPRIGRRRMLP